MKLLSSNSKLAKSVEGFYLLGLQLAPSNLSGRNVCAHASAGCAAACLFTAGMGVYSNVIQSRINKTKFFFERREEFMVQLALELTSARKKAAKAGLKLAIRLNTISDIPWENVKVGKKSLMAMFPDVQFYDYTKNPTRALAYAQGKMPENYHLTFSRSECNEAIAQLILANGGSVAVVFSTRAGKKGNNDDLPKTWHGKRVIDGDTSDGRFLDPQNVVVGLRAKGKAKKDLSGFVVQV